MALFLGLYLGHILGDFVFQPGRLVIAKREHMSAAILHSAIVTVCTALVLAGTLRSAWIAVAAAGAGHLAVEQFSIEARRNPKVTGLTVFLLDQALHVVTLTVIALLAVTKTPPVIGAWETSVEMLATLCGMTTVAFAGSILVFEVQRWRGQSDPSVSPVLGLDLARVYGMAERAVALMAALVLPNPLLGSLVFAPRVVCAAIFKGGDRTAHRAATVVGLALTALGWVLVTSVVNL